MGKHLRQWLVLEVALACAADALRLTSGHASGKADDELPTTAMCIAGNARTLPMHSVRTSLSNFTRELKTRGFQQSRGPDVFAFLTLEGAGPKGQKDWNFGAVNVRQDDAVSALTPLNPIKVVTDPESDEVTADNIDQYVVNREQCFSRGYWKKTPDGLRRSMNQLVHWQHCLDLIVDYEKVVGKKYDAVIIARPDLNWGSAEGTNMFNVAFKRHFLCHKDWVMAMPRWMMDYLIDPAKARPLRCNPGEACCGTVGQSEVLWEYLMGVRPDNRSSCHCGPNGTWAAPVHENILWNAARVARPVARLEAKFE